MPLLPVALALLCVVGPLSTDMYLPVLPGLAGELGTDASGAQLTLTAFLAGMVLGHPVFGPLADRFGRRRPLLAGAVGCAVATGLCALAPTLPWLIAFRFAAGFCGAAGVVLSRAVVADVLTGVRAARLAGLLVTLGGLAPVVAPPLGGAVAGTAGWRGVFWALTGVAVVVAAAVLVGVPETLPPERRVTGGTAGFARSVRAVVRDRAYLGYTGAFGFGFAVLFCWIAGAPFLLRRILGPGTGGTSAVFTAGAAITALTGLLSARLVGRVAPERLLRTGLRLLLGGSAALLAVAVAVPGDRVAAPLVLPPLGVICAGLGLVTPNAAALALSRLPYAAGTASALLGTFQSAAGALVAPLMGLGGGSALLPLAAGTALCSTAALLSARAATATAPGEPEVSRRSSR
ncbi:multidrug effflux MFS transporter [Streptomyces sp. NPDC006798]|uniref:multidrug effflux MFS transporter n=1 Tax=Streptomyces sp. NPDC006798 TaxID=3155462 RepID=UPI0033E4F010